MSLPQLPLSMTLLKYAFQNVKNMILLQMIGSTNCLCDSLVRKDSRKAKLIQRWMKKLSQSSQSERGKKRWMVEYDFQVRMKAARWTYTEIKPLRLSFLTWKNHVQLYLTAFSLHLITFLHGAIAFAESELWAIEMVSQSELNPLHSGGPWAALLDSALVGLVSQCLIFHLLTVPQSTVTSLQKY